MKGFNLSEILLNANPDAWLLLSVDNEASPISLSMGQSGFKKISC